MNFINNVSIATDTKRLMKKVERALCSEDCGVMETLPATESGSRNFIITTEGEPLIEPLGKLASAFSEQGRLILLNHHRCEDSQKVGASLHWKHRTFRQQACAETPFLNPPFVYIDIAEGEQVLMRAPANCFGEVLNEERRKRLILTVLSDEQEKGYVYDPALAQFQCIIGVLKSFEHQCLEEDTRNDWSRILDFEITKEFSEWCS